MELNYILLHWTTKKDYEVKKSNTSCSQKYQKEDAEQKNKIPASFLNEGEMEFLTWKPLHGWQFAYWRLFQVILAIWRPLKFIEGKTF